MTRRRIFALLAAVALSGERRAFAQAAAPTYDSRANAMGTATDGNVDSPAALYRNAALLALSTRPAVMLTSVTGRAHGSAPVTADDVSSHQASTLLAGFVGASVPVTRALTIGISASPVTGSAGDFDTAAGKVKLQAGLLEVIVGAAYRLDEKLSLGAEYRVTYALFQQEQPSMLPGGGVVRAKTDLNGVGFFGAGFGALYQPTPTTRIGLAYRSRVVVNIDGNTEAAGAPGPHVATSIASPDQISLGGAQDLLEGRVVVAAEVLASFQGILPDTTTTVTAAGAPPMVTTAANHAPTIYSARAGAEFWVVPRLAVRGGLFFESAASNAATVTPFTRPPAPVFGLGTGLGTRTEHFAIDGSFFASTRAEHDFALPPSSGAHAGTYSYQQWSAVVSVAYRFGTERKFR